MITYSNHFAIFTNIDDFVHPRLNVISIRPQLKKKK